MFEAVNFSQLLSYGNYADLNILNFDGSITRSPRASPSTYCAVHRVNEEGHSVLFTIVILIHCNVAASFWWRRAGFVRFTWTEVRLCHANTTLGSGGIEKF